MRKQLLRRDGSAKTTQLRASTRADSRVYCLQGPVEGVSDFRVDGGCVCGSERQSVGPQDRGGQQRRMRTRLLCNPSWGLSGGEQVAPFGEGSGSWKQVLSCMRNWHYSVLWVLTPFGCNCHFSVLEGKSWRADPGCPGIPALSRCPVNQEGFGIEKKFPVPGGQSWFIVHVVTRDISLR